MTKPNFIPGMRLKGIGRKSSIPFRLSKARAYEKSTARRIKSEKEQARKNRGLNESNT